MTPAAAALLWASWTRRLGTTGVLPLVVGSGAAQLIPLLCMPFLTRLYPPTSFGTFAAFGSVLGLVGIVATGRYHLAIPLADDRAEASAVYWLSRRVCRHVSLFLALPLGLAIGWSVDTWLARAAWVVGLPLSVWAVGTTDLLTYWALRVRNERSIARATFVRTLGSQLGQLGLGVVSAVAGSMVGGMIIGQLLGNHTLRSAGVPGPAPHKAQVAAGRRFHSFPRFEMISHGSSSLTTLGVPLGIGAIYGAHELGLYALASRVLAIPAAVVGVAAGQYCLREFAVRTSTGRRRLARRVSLGLIVAAAPVGLVLLASSRDLFGLVLGDEWQTAGTVALAMWPMVWVRLGASPLGGVFAVVRRQNELMWGQLVLAAASGAALLLAWGQGLSLITLVVTHSLLSATVSIWMLLRAWRIA